MNRAAGPSSLALGGVLAVHLLVGFVWIVVFLSAAFLTSSETGGTDLTLVLGGLCWLLALPLIVKGWESGSYWYWGVPFVWATVFTTASVLAINASVSASLSAASSPPGPGRGCPARSPPGESGGRQASHGVSRIAFQSDRDGNPEIYVMNADGSNQRRLTRNKTEDLEPAWSPDGSRIAFLRQCWYGGGRYDYDNEIFVMNADGGGQRNLTRSERWDDESPAWSPDGTRIAFVSDRGHGGDSYWSIFVMDADGGHQRAVVTRVSRFAHPTWSPDGREIAFVGGAAYRIFVMKSDGRQQRPVTNARVESWEPAWSPIGDTIAFSRSADDDAIFTVHSDGQGELRLTHEPGEKPAWAPDGTRLAFVRDGEIYVVSGDGSGETRLTHDSADDSEPSWQRRRR